MSNIDKRALREAAEKATPGDWKYSTFDCAITDDTSSLAIVRMDSGHLNDEQSALNGAFIAAANPATVLALLDELKAKGKRIAELEAREVVLPQRYSMLHRVDFDEPYHTEMAYKQHQVLEALHDAGVNVAAAGKGEAS
ncbi:ead/Ea22-like family protein [Enterobacter sp. A103]|uniref:ead/Ea22-like family protein n=1 Tax=Enterobacter sp. A103 TaxID=3102785 RepID=UPI002ACABB71|nr:ead/Ea22-like family protein [Enterobacter sp. A103]MDZ5639022.1 ead/Ea22-like family protein [Enterobacter sp. A103]